VLGFNSIFRGILVLAQCRINRLPYLPRLSAGGGLTEFSFSRRPESWSLLSIPFTFSGPSHRVAGLPAATQPPVPTPHPEHGSKRALLTIGFPSEWPQHAGRNHHAYAHPTYVVGKGVKGAGKPLLVPIGAENASVCLRIARQSCGNARRNSLIAIPVVPSNNQPSRRHEVSNE
jgi:hypothetical protein